MYTAVYAPCIQSRNILIIPAHITTEFWVLMFWPEEDSTTVIRKDHLSEGIGYQVGSDCVVRNLPNHTGKVTAIGLLAVCVCVCARAPCAYVNY